MTQTDELMQWTCEQKAKKTVEALTGNGFTALYFPTVAGATAYILKEAEDIRTIGFGGSMTIAGMGIETVFADQGKEILNHSLPDLSLDEKVAMMRRALTCDLYLCSTNAITCTGHLVNIDATGNRVAAMIFGPKKVIVVAGRNKIIEGDGNAAIRRVKDWATPPNANRLNFKTPCASTGFCSDCNAPQRLCRAVTILERCPRMTDIHVLIVNEDLGF